MKTIYKYIIPQGYLNIIKLPIGAKILTVQIQHGTPCIWALVDNEIHGFCERTFIVHLTGDSILEGEEYLATLQLDNGNYVIHIYEQLS